MRASLVLLLLVGCGRGDDSTRTVDDTWTAKNLLILSIDTLRRDHVGRFDTQARQLTPFLDGRMAEGVVAENHVACANWTFPTTACALSGRNALDMGALPKLAFAAASPWDPEIRFVVDELEDAGFETVLSHGNGWMERFLGMTDPFDDIWYKDFEAAEQAYAHGSELLQARLDRAPDARWHLHLHLMEPHQPYIAPAEYRIGEDALAPSPWNLDTQADTYATARDAWEGLSADEQALLQAHLQVRYEAEIRWVDAQIAAMWADMDARGWLDDTLVLVWSDHGEQLWEHGRYSHGYGLNAEESDALFFAWGRGLEPRSIEVPTAQEDVAATALHHLGLPVPEAMTGIPLGDATADRPLFADTRGRGSGISQSVLKDGKKLIYRWDGTASFYDRTTDPAEQDDRFDAADPEVQALWALLRPRVHQGDDAVPDESPTAVPGLDL